MTNDINITVMVWALVALWASLPAEVALAANDARGHLLSAMLPGAAAFDGVLLNQLNHRRKQLGADDTPRTRHKRSDGWAVYTNRLFLETSPYLLQHAHNPVNWYPWDKAWVPNRTLTVSEEGDQLEAHARLVPVARGKIALQGKASAYVCIKGVCELPTTMPDQFDEQIRQVHPLNPARDKAPSS